MATALIAIACIAVPCYFRLSSHIEGQIIDSLESQLGLIETKLSPVYQSAKHFGDMLMLAEGDSEDLTTDDCQELLLSFFLSRPELVTGLSFIQPSYGLFTSVEYFCPYLYFHPKLNEKRGKPLASPHEYITYSELETDEQCHTHRYYKEGFIKPEDHWLEPFEWSGLRLSTFNHLIKNQLGTVVGAIQLDVNLSDISDLLSIPAVAQQGYFAIVSKNGTLVSYPPVPKFNGKPISNAPELSDQWTPLLELHRQSLLTSSHLYAAAPITNTDWHLVAVAPRSIILSSILHSLGLAILCAIAIVSLVVSLMVRGLKQKLAPILRDCDTMLAFERQTPMRNNIAQRSADSTIPAPHIPKDEIEFVSESISKAVQRLTDSFSNLEQLVGERTKELALAKDIAERANTAKSEFLANMSHELRTPLNGILGFAQILKESEHLTLNEQQGVQTIQSCGTHLLSLINEVLDLAKIEAKKMEFVTKPFDLKPFLENLISTNLVLANEKNIHLSGSVATNAPRTLIGDEKRLRQILTNIIGNAIKFTKFGSVLVSVEAGGGRRDGMCEIICTVTDTGVGIDSQVLEKLFEPFEQAGSEEMRSEGIGLGLAISKQLAELMGGSLSAKSTVGKGSQFVATLPFSTPHSASDATSQTTSSRKVVGYSGDTKTILVVDDIDNNRAVLVSALTAMRFNVIEAEGGQDGLNKLSELAVDLVISDISMPGMSGYDFIRRIKQDNPLQSIPVIACSASVSKSDEARCYEVGAAAFLPKPVELAILRSQLESLLDIVWQYRET
jgi:signal transduction histidine kinase